MTEDEKLDQKGYRLFSAMSEDDKRALKRFLTGQIQNILANEHGIGGQRSSKNAAAEAAREAVNKVMIRDDFLDMVCNRIVAARRTNIDGLVKAAVEKSADQAVARVVGAAASRISVKVFVEPELPAEGMPDNFAKF